MAGLSGHFERSWVDWSVRVLQQHPGRPERAFRDSSGSRAVNSGVVECGQNCKAYKASKAPRGNLHNIDLL